MSSFADDGERRVGRVKNLVGFELGDVHYAIDISRVREIIHPLPTVELPHAPPAVLGVADHRGEVVPVVDVRTRFNLPRVAPTRRNRWVVVDSSSGATALAVDAVTDVFGTNPEDQRTVPSLGKGDDARAIVAVYASHGRLVFVIDVDRIAAVAAGIDVELAAGLLDGGPR